MDFVFGKELKLERVLVQSDVLVIMDCINSILKFVVIEPIAADCRFFLSKFKVAFVMYLSRTLNVDAHKLVGMGKLYGSRTWIEGYPILEPGANVLVLFSS